jgi:serine/threonine protein kinase
MITALSFLHNSKFTDEEGKDHIGIIHNDIKPEIFYLRKLLKRLFFKRKNYWNI